MKIPLLFPLVIAAVTPVIAQAQSTYWWAAASGGNWSEPANWTLTEGSGVTYPDSGDIAVLGSVDGGSSRVVSYDGAASGALSTLTMTQTSSGTNELKMLRNLTVANDATLGGAGASVLHLAAATTTGTLTVQFGSGAGNLTLNSGGVLELGSYGSSVVNGNISIAGGALNNERGVSASKVNTINGSVAISGGVINLTSAAQGYTATSTDTRLTINGNLTSTGGSISASSAAALVLNGATNDLSGLTAFPTGNLTTYLSGTTAGTLDQSLTLGANTVNKLIIINSTASSSATKTISATTGKVGAIFIRNSANNATSVLKLGGNITLADNAATPVSYTSSDSKTGVASTIDTASYTLDLSPGAGAFTPNSQNGQSVTWNLQGDGTIKARSFVFSSSKATVNVSGNVTLQVSGSSTGVNGRVIDLSSSTGSGTIAASTKLLYSGGDSEAAPATLISNRAIGALAVESGYLKVNQAALTAGGDVTITGGILDLNGLNSAGLLTLAMNKNFEMTGGVFRIDLGVDLVQGDSGSFGLSDAILDLNVGAGFDYTKGYAVFSGFSDGSMAHLAIIGYDTAEYSAVLSNAGVLSFVAVPEPGTTGMLIVGGFGILAMLKRRQYRLG